jgi:hypothetical protein
VRRTPFAITLALIALIALIATSQPCLAQRPPLAAPCQDAAFLLTAAERTYCFAIAQTIVSAQPLLGILITQGDPAPGAGADRSARRGGAGGAGADGAAAGGVGAGGAGADGAAAGGAGTGGGLARFAATGRIGAVEVRLPDVRRQQTAATERLDHAATALAGTATVALFPGFSPAPGVSGVGSVTAIGSVAWLPFHIVKVTGLADDAAELAWGAGGRLGLLGESALLPAASLSVVHRRLSRVSHGVVCVGGAGGGTEVIRGSGRGYDFAAGTCAVPADPGEFSFDLAVWSGRASVVKTLSRIGIAAGAGYDQLRSDVAFGVGANPVLPGIGAQPVYVRGSGLSLRQGRWSGFLNGVVALRRASVVAEAGWLQGGSTGEGFDAAASTFDPRRGALFGGLAVRVGPAARPR